MKNLSHSDSKNRKFALCLSGGGANGAFHVGVVEALHEIGIKHFDLVYGISAGAIVGSNVNNLPRLQEMWGLIAGHPENVFIPYYTDHNFKVKPGKAIRSLLKSKIGSLASNRPLFDIIARFVNWDEVSSNYYVGFTSLEDGQEYFVNYQDMLDLNKFHKAILASASMLPIWEPVSCLKMKDGNEIHFACDGGLRTVSPFIQTLNKIREIKQEGEEWTIICVNCRDHKPNQLLKWFEKGNIFKFIFAGYSVMQAQIFEDDQSYICDICNLEGIKILEINPYRNRELPSKLDFSLDSMNYSRQLGYEIALKTEF